MVQEGRSRGVECLHERRRGPTGKLKAAARSWALSRQGRADDRAPATLDADLEAQFARMGVRIEGATGPAEPEAFEVMGQNRDALRVWLACETQWRVVSGMAGTAWLGLDYSAVDVVLRRVRVGDPDQVFADLQLMETEALAAFREAR